MAYKNDGNLVIANRYGAASSDAKAMLYETYDRLRDLTVSGSASSGTGFEAAGGFLYQLASLFAPSAFMTALGGTTAMNIPGTSYWSQYTGGNGGLTGTYSSFGVNSLGHYSGFPSGYGLGASGVLLPLAGIVSGWGGIMTAAAPYLGEFGLPAIVMGNLMQGTTSAALSAYQSVSQNVLSNADTILSQKVANIETVCKMLDTQSDIVRKMLKDELESNSKEIDNL